MRGTLGHRSVVLAALAAGCFYLPPSTILTIISPSKGSSAGYSSSLTFEATAINPSGLKSLELDSGGANGSADVVLSVCRASGASVTTLDCQAIIVPSDNTALFSDGTLTLSATAVDKAGVVSSQTISVTVNQITCGFQLPAVTAGTDPPEAEVSSEEPITVAVSSEFQVEEVVVTSDTDVTVAFWEASPYTMRVDWCATLGEGTHGLTVSCQDVQGNTGSDNLQVQVQCTSSTCTSDAQCSAPTPRCDTNVHQCVQCATFSDCPPNNSCIQDICEQECSSNVECPSGQSCIEGNCTPDALDAGF